MYLSAFSILLPLLLGAVLFKTLTKSLWILYAFILVSAVLEVSTAVMNLNGVNNLILFNLFTHIEFVFLSLVFREVFPYNYQKKLVLLVSLTVELYFIYTFVFSDLFTFNSMNRIIEATIFITYSIWFIATVLNRSKAPYLEMNPYFILACGILIYFAGTIFVFVIEDRLDGNSFMPVWTIHSLLNIFLNIIFASVIWRNKPTSRT